MKILLSIIALFILINSQAQADLFSDLNAIKENSGKVHVFQNAEIRTLMNDYIDKKKNEKGMLGYRVQIFFGSGHLARENANNIRNSFVSSYKKIPVHVVFEDPNFKVRVGDFRTKSEALKVLVKVKETYEGAYIVKDFIEFPKLD